MAHQTPICFVALGIISTAAVAVLLVSSPWTSSHFSLQSSTTVTHSALKSPLIAAIVPQIPSQIAGQVHSIPVTNAVPSSSLVSGLPSPSSPSWAISLFGGLSMALGVIAGYLIGSRSNESAPLLAPMAMLNSTATHEMRDAAEVFTLWVKEGYTILDVRSEMERSEGRIRGANKVAEIPLITASTYYDQTLGKMVMTQEPNPEWLDLVKTRFPQANAKLIVMCSDGVNRTKQALDLLSAQGYWNLIGMTGGYKRWDQLFDRQQRPRTKQAQQARVANLNDPMQWITWTGSSTLGGLKSPAAAAKVQPTQAPTAAPQDNTVPTARMVFPVVEYAIYTDPSFQAATIAAFPAKANASVEEARVLWKLDGYALLDVRSDMEGQEGRIQGPNKRSVDVPMFQAQVDYDSIQGAKVFSQQPNVDWLRQVKERFPNKDARIIVVCSDGTNRSTQALNLLATEGYKNLVRMVGGYNRWDQVFDKTLALRTAAQQSSKVDWLEDPIKWGKWGGAAAGVNVGPMDFSAGLAASGTPVALGLYQDPTFQRATIAAFPAKREATIEEARVLWKLDGYTLVDIRSDMEGRDGRVKGPNKRSVDIPMFQARKDYDDRVGKKIVIQTANTSWLQQMKELFAQDSKLLIMCSDGTNRSSQAIDILAAEGYTNLVRMSGGYNAWDQVFDSRLALRSPQQQAAKADWLADPVPWMKWTAFVGDVAAPKRPTENASAPAPQMAKAEGNMPVAPFQDALFQRSTIAAFPAKRYANIDESRVLWKLDNYALVDIRSDMEGADGRVRGPNKGSIDIPIFQAKTMYDSALGRRVVKSEPNREWLNQMKERFPPETKIVLMCSDGSTRSEQALRLLTEAGYPNVVVMQGGHKKWDQIFDSRLAIRPQDVQARKAQDLQDDVEWGSWA